MFVQFADRPYAEWLKAPGRPTVLIYGHYDVQPAEPLERWKTAPFEPTVIDGFLHGRGSSDDKGPLFSHVWAACAWLKATGGLSLNVKFMIEGDEESGGEAIEEFVKGNVERLRADFCVISDTSMFAAGIPAITYGLRGLAYYEIRLRGAKEDVHSGTFGGAVPNPANALVSILAGIKGSDGRILIDGFYDDVLPLEPWERKEWAALPFLDETFRQSAGAQALSGEVGYSTLERKWGRPTFDVHGLTSGYQGPGPKTIIPAEASAKVSFRLVPGQDPQKVTQRLKARLRTACPPGLSFELVEYVAAPAVLLDVKGNRGFKAAARAIEAEFGRPPAYIREGGSIPVVGLLKQHLGVEAILIGWGRPNDNIHGPNERFSMEDFHRACKANARFLRELGQLKLNR